MEYMRKGQRLSKGHGLSGSVVEYMPVLYFETGVAWPMTQRGGVVG